MVNPGMAIFRRYQRFQRGTENLEPNTDPVPPWLRAGYDPEAPGAGEWVSPSGMHKRASAKEASGLYAPSVDDEQMAKQNAMQVLREGVYGTIGINVDGEEREVPLWNADMTPEEAEEAARMRWEWNLSSFASDAELEAAQNKAHQGPDDASAVKNAGSPNYELPPRYAMGTSNVNNPGLRLFYRKQMLKKPKL